MRSKYIVIFVGFIFVNQIDAQENEAIENIIVSASKNEQKLEDVISPALVINENEIAVSGFRSVSDLLHSLGGINVSQNGGLVNSHPYLCRDQTAITFLFWSMVSRLMIWLQEYQPFKIYPFL